MLLQWNISLSKDTIVQVWQSAANAKLTTAAGYQTIVGSYDYWYLDCGRGQWLDFGPKVERQFYPFLDYCNPVKNWRLIYSYDPLFNLTAKEAKLIIGGEVHLWSEQTDEHNLDRMLWPRASAAGEILWSGRQDANGKNRTLTDAAVRLQEFRERMVVRGTQAEPFTQQWCIQRRGECEFH
jgi:hexosaminidase